MRPRSQPHGPAPRPARRYHQPRQQHRGPPPTYQQPPPPAAPFFAGAAPPPPQHHHHHAALAHVPHAAPGQHYAPPAPAHHHAHPHHYSHTQQPQHRAPPATAEAPRPSHLTDVAFASLPLAPESQRALAEVLRFTHLTAVQHATLPQILTGADVMAKAKTGTGKTQAFLIPAVEQLKRSPPPAGACGGPMWHYTQGSRSAGAQQGWQQQRGLRGMQSAAQLRLSLPRTLCRPDFCAGPLPHP